MTHTPCFALGSRVARSAYYEWIWACVFHEQFLVLALFSMIGLVVSVTVSDSITTVRFTAEQEGKKLHSFGLEANALCRIWIELSL